MSNEPRTMDWAAFSDEEDDEDYSPVNEHSNEQIPHEEDQREYEGDQGVERIDLGIKKESSVQAVPMSAEELRESMINHIKNNPNPKVYLNLHGLDPSITEKDIRDFYHPLNIDRLIPNQKKDMFDLEFSSKDEALKMVEKGAGTIGKCTFAMRMSRRTQYNERKQQDPNRRDKNGKGYGKKGQPRNYNKDRGDRGDQGGRENRGGNYGLNRQGSYKGDYNQRDSYNQRGSYNQGNREDRGGNYNYDRQDSGANRRRNDDRNQRGPRKDNYNQQQQQQQQAPTQNVKPQVQEDEKQAEEAPRRMGFFNKNKEEEVQREKQKQEELKKQEEEQAELKRQEELRLEKERQEEQQRQLQKQEEERQRKFKEEEQLKEAQKNQVAQGEREGGQRGQEYSDNQKRGDRNYPRKDDNQRRKDYGGDRKYDNRQKNNRNQYDNRKGDDYYQNYKGEENKQDSTPKYGQGNTSEQNKELQVVKRQSSYRSQGSGKYYSEKSGGYTPKYANFEEDWGYDDDYSGNYQKREYQAIQGNARTPKGNSNSNYDETGKVSRKSSKPYDKDSVVYMKKQESQPAPQKTEPALDINKHASEPANKDAKKEPAKKNPALPSSKNKVNPYDLLRGNT